MSTQFFGPKNRLFPLFRHLIAMKSDFISFSWDFIAMRTVVIPYEDGRHTNEDGREGDEDGRHGDRALKNPWDIWSAVRFILLQAILQELIFITLLAFPSHSNQIVRFPERSRHPIPSVVSQNDQNHEKSQSKMDQDFRRNRKTHGKGGYCIFNIFKIH